MTNLAGGHELIIMIELLPSLGDQMEQVRPIDGDLTVEHRKLKLAPHDVGDVQWLRLRETRLLTEK